MPTPNESNPGQSATPGQLVLSMTGFVTSKVDMKDVKFFHAISS